MPSSSRRSASFLLPFRPQSPRDAGCNPHHRLSHEPSINPLPILIPNALALIHPKHARANELHLASTAFTGTQGRRCSLLASSRCSPSTRRAASSSAAFLTCAMSSPCLLSAFSSCFRSCPQDTFSSAAATSSLRRLLPRHHRHRFFLRGV